jgi:hypothetical protein
VTLSTNSFVLLRLVIFAFRFTPLLPPAPYLFYDTASLSSWITLLCSILELTIICKENVRCKMHLDSVILEKLIKFLYAVYSVAFTFYREEISLLLFLIPKDG